MTVSGAAGVSIRAASQARSSYSTSGGRQGSRQARPAAGGDRRRVSTSSTSSVTASDAAGVSIRAASQARSSYSTSGGWGDRQRGLDKLDQRRRVRAATAGGGAGTRLTPETLPRTETGGHSRRVEHRIGRTINEARKTCHVDESVIQMFQGRLIELPPLVRIRQPHRVTPMVRKQRPPSRQKVRRGIFGDHPRSRSHCEVRSRIWPPVPTTLIRQRPVRPDQLRRRPEIGNREHGPRPNDCSQPRRLERNEDHSPASERVHRVQPHIHFDEVSEIRNRWTPEKSRPPQHEPDQPDPTRSIVLIGCESSGKQRRDSLRIHPPVDEAEFAPVLARGCPPRQFGRRRRDRLDLDIRHPPIMDALAALASHRNTSVPTSGRPPGTQKGRHPCG